MMGFLPAPPKSIPLRKYEKTPEMQNASGSERMLESTDLRPRKPVVSNELQCTAATSNLVYASKSYSQTEKLLN
jgi:hypothetical protein